VRRDVSEHPGPDPDLTPALLAGVRALDLEMLQQTAGLLVQREGKEGKDGMPSASRVRCAPASGSRGAPALGFTGKKQVGRRPKETTMWMSTSNTLNNGNQDLSATEQQF
jgi:hypothetical protein